MMDGKRMRDAAAVTVRGNDRHLAECLQRLGERDDSRTFSTVVVGNENPQIIPPVRVDETRS